MRKFSYAQSQIKKTKARQSYGNLLNRYSIPRASFSKSQKVNISLKTDKSNQLEEKTNKFIKKSDPKRIKTDYSSHLNTRYKSIQRTTRPIKSKIPTKNIESEKQDSRLNNIDVRILKAPSAIIPMKNENYRFPQIYPSKLSTKQYGNIKGYAANTHQGLYRNYNQDRISIVLNLSHQIQLNYFGIFDGHGGTICAEYLSNNLHTMIVEQLNKSNNIQNAIKKAFLQIQNRFIILCKSRSPLDRSGSCAVVAVVMGNNFYVANLGDSRALYITDKEVKQITRDHKPDDQRQRERIQTLGGRLYRSQIQTYKKGEVKYGPIRVWPGKLTVSRTFGDIQAKVEQFGGINEVVSIIPDIFCEKITPGGILVLACDGIYDRLSNKEIKEIFLKQKSNQNNKELEFLGKGIQKCFFESFVKDTYDNISMISIAF